MATVYRNQQCSMCNERNGLYTCNECNEIFCSSHVEEHEEKIEPDEKIQHEEKIEHEEKIQHEEKIEHEEKIQQEFHHIEHSYHLLQEKILTKKNDFNQHLLIEIINQWEINSIKKIKQTAGECREILIDYMNKYTRDIEDQLKETFEQLKQINQTNEYNDIDFKQLKERLNKLKQINQTNEYNETDFKQLKEKLNKLKEKLHKLKEEFNKLSDVTIEEKTSSQFINEIYVSTSNINKVLEKTMSGQQDYLQKGICSAQKATAEDKAQNYEAAIQHYMIAADWLMHAMKYGVMNAQMKQAIRPKIGSYVERAEEIRRILKNGLARKKAIGDTTNGRGNSIDNKGDDDDNGDPDKRRMMQKFERAFVTDSNVTFADVVGLKQAKGALNEVVILPVKFPHLFQGNRKPWTSILFYGPSGTGKSYLAQAIAAECKSTFISVSSSDLLSTWLGESEKGVKCLFELARERQPCIVFIDEIDALYRQCNYIESESLRCVKTEFLVQMQGVETDNSCVSVLATTNVPWTLDAAIRQQFRRRIYIPLPDVNERADMFKTHVGTSTFHTIKDHEWLQLAKRAENYSGADIAVVCRKALLGPIHRLDTGTHFKRVQNPKPNGPRQLWLLSSPADPAAVPMTLDQITPEELCEPPVTISDMIAALATEKATIRDMDLVKQMEFTREYGEISC